MSISTLANKPENFEANFVNPLELQVKCRISEKGDYNIFTIRLEDHTIGNLINTQMTLDPEVTFCAYRMPHPLRYCVEIYVRPKGYMGAKLLAANINRLSSQVNKLKEEFIKKAHIHKERMIYQTVSREDACLLNEDVDTRGDAIGPAFSRTR